MLQSRFARATWTAALALLAMGISCSTGSAQESEDPARRAAERAIEDRNDASTGIRVEDPKVYDDSLLQEMLRAAEARLASLQLLDQSGIASHLGATSGATQSISSFGLSIQGPSLPQVATTNNGATNSTVSTDQTVGTVSATPSTVTTNGTVTTAGAPVTNVTTTAPQLNAPAVTAPASTTSLPSGVNVSASDILAEQMQLTYQIANLRLLLEGALSDRVVGPNNRLRPHVTLGFPISVEPSKRYKNALAVVEIEVDASTDNRIKGTEEEAPIVLSLLPQEKTYNVAKITDRNTSIGAGIVTQVVGISASFGSGHKTYYLAQDQDTLALTFDPSVNANFAAKDRGKRRVGFLWQFRPVLGDDYVREGFKQTFVQLAFPNLLTAPVFGSVHIRTYWRCYDRKHNLVKGVVQNSLREYSTDLPIKRYSLAQSPFEFNPNNVEDLGNGQMLVTLHGLFLGGTYVRLGSSVLRDGSPNFLSEFQQIQFVAPIADLATKDLRLVSRDGSETELEFSKAIYGDANELRIQSYRIVTVDQATSELTINLEHQPNMTAPPVLLIGGCVFGYADSPARWIDPSTFSILLPTAFLRDHPQLAVRALFTNKDYWQNAVRPLTSLPLLANSSKLVLLEEQKKYSTFLLYGNDLAHTSIVSPKVQARPLGSPPIPNVRVVKIDQAVLKATKVVALENSDGEFLEVSIPEAKKDDAAKGGGSFVPPGPLTVGTDEFVLLGTGLDQVQKVTFKGVELKLQKQADGKALWISGLKALGVSSKAGTEALEVDFKTGNQSITLNIVAAK